jgi:DNA-binding transcriptional regulator YiaG
MMKEKKKSPTESFRVAEAPGAFAPASPANVAELCEKFGIKREAYARLAGLSLRTVASLASGRSLSKATQKQVTEATRLIEALGGILEPEALGAWLEAPNPAFGGSSPLQIAERGEADRLWRMVYELGSGEPL